MYQDKQPNKLISLALIPARGGSKRIKDKNISLLGGQPLIAYTIETLLSEGCFDRLIVSTDSPRIADISRHFGAEVPFLRSPQTSGHRADLLDAISEVLDNLQMLDGYVPDIVGLFLPSSPFRRPGKVREIHRRVAQGAQSGNLLRKVDLEPDNFFYRDHEGNIRKWAGANAFAPRSFYLRNVISIATYHLDWKALGRQGITPQTNRYFRHFLSWFRNNEYVYFDKDDLESDDPVTGRWIYVSYASPEESMDINLPEDLALAEEILKKRREVNVENRVSLGQQWGFQEAKQI